MKVLVGILIMLAALGGVAIAWMLMVAMAARLAFISWRLYREWRRR